MSKRSDLVLLWLFRLHKPENSQAIAKVCHRALCYLGQYWQSTLASAERDITCGALAIYTTATTTCWRWRVVSYAPNLLFVTMLRVLGNNNLTAFFSSPIKSVLL